MSEIGNATIDKCGNMLELTVRSQGMTTGLGVLLSPDQWAALMGRAEELEPMRQYRMREARSGQSHEARASRR